MAWGTLLTTHTIKSRFEEVGPMVDRVVAACCQRLVGYPGSDDISDAIRLGLTEAVNNIIEHSYRMEPDHRLIIEVEGRRAKFVILIRDMGRPFPEPLATRLCAMGPVRPPQTGFEPDDLEHLSEGGWGLMLMQGTMDQIKVTRTGRENRLILEKKFENCGCDAAIAGDP